MVFQSFQYVLVFLPLMLAIYFVVRRSARLSNILLVVGSAIFYAWNTLWWLFPLLISATVDYIAGVKMSAPGMRDPAFRKRMLLLSLVANLGMLSAFKYLGWLSLSLNQALAYFGVAASIPVIATTLPPGISFYTFETMSYTIDVYRGHYKSEPSFLVYLNFVLFFPHLVAGPILRPKDLIWQLREVRPIATAEEIRLALCQIIWGLFKKVVLADNFGDVVTHAEYSIYAPPYDSAGAGLIYALAFALQIYCDFSAYTDIARGSALLFGIKLPRNFLTPLFARSPREFWQRWHISLSTWIRDYVYIPLGGNSGSRLRASMTLVATMALAGLWHGAGILFIAWGLYHALLLLVYRRPAISRLTAESETGLRAFVAGLVFFVLNLFGWLMFRAASDGHRMFRLLIRTMGHLPAAIHSESFLRGAMQVGLLSLPLLVTDWIAYRRQTEFPDVLHGLKAIPLTIVLVAVWFAGVVFAKRSGYDFIYFAF